MVGCKRYLCNQLIKNFLSFNDFHIAKPVFSISTATNTTSAWRVYSMDSCYIHKTILWYMYMHQVLYTSCKNSSLASSFSLFITTRIPQWDNCYYTITILSGVKQYHVVLFEGVLLYCLYSNSTTLGYWLGMWYQSMNRVFNILAKL